MGEHGGSDSLGEREVVQWQEREREKGGNLLLLDWWASSGYELLYDKEVLMAATRKCRVESLQWWLESGRKIWFRWADVEEAIEDAIGGKRERERTVTWWRERGFDSDGGDMREWAKLRSLDSEGSPSQDAG
ncbi:hypothetical protein BT69DRAFT_1331022 [Atractiella rhizophila]|nr:hypothetical protein BT69DRAFT_1331022 [Atractiella rhizophila]